MWAFKPNRGYANEFYCLVCLSHLKPYPTVDMRKDKFWDHIQTHIHLVDFDLKTMQKLPTYKDDFLT